MLIRPLTPDDFEAVDALWRRTDGVGPVPESELLRLLAVTPELVLVAELDGRIAGAVIGTDDGRRGWIFRLAVDESVRGHGVGRELVTEVERRLAARGIRHVRLLVLADNQLGLGFWTHAGYEGYDRVVLFGKELAGDTGDTEPASGC